MTQSLFAGCTDYTEQSLEDIRKDIAHWKKLSAEVKEEFRGIIQELTECGYWEKNVPSEFRSFCGEIMTICDTFSHDFSMVLAAIDQDSITKREIAIMNNIYQVAHERERECPKVYRTNNSRWHEYGDENFEKANDLYAHGRDYFVTLFDVGTAVFRLEHYMKEETKIDKSIHAENSIIVGNDNKIEKSTFQTGTKKPGKGIKIWLTEHFWLPLIVAVVAGLIIWYITR